MSSSPTSQRQPSSGPHRKNVSSACRSCRGSRLKCDGNETCSRCSRRGLLCVYDVDGRRGNSLQKRNDAISEEVAQLRAELQALKASQNTNVLGSNNGSLPSPHQSYDPTSNPSTSTTRPRTSEQTHSVGFFNDRFTGESIHYGTSAFHLILNESYEESSMRDHREHPPATTSTSSDHVYTFNTLPPSIHSELLNLYFDYLNGSVGFIDEQAFRDAWISGSQSPSYSRFLHLAVLCCASHLSRHQGLRSDLNDPSTSGNGFLKEALSMVESECDNPRVTSAIALTLLAGPVADQTRDSLAWIYSGMAMRILFHLGLHVESNKDQQARQVRRNALWAIFCEDKLMCLYTGRACCLQLDDLAVPMLHASHDLFPVTSAHASASKLARLEVEKASVAAFSQLSVVCGNVIRELYGVHSRTRSSVSPVVFGRLERSLRSWSENLPPDLQDGPTGIRTQVPSVILLHTLYRSVLLLLHRPFWRRASGGVSPSQQNCLESATRVMDLVALYDAVHGMNRANIMFTHSTYTAATTLLLLFVDEEQEDRRQLIADALFKGVRGLSMLATSWKCAFLALTSIEYLARNCLTESHLAQESLILATLAQATNNSEPSGMNYGLNQQDMDSLVALLNDDPALWQPEGNM